VSMIPVVLQHPLPPTVDDLGPEIDSRIGASSKQPASFPDSRRGLLLGFTAQGGTRTEQMPLGQRK
jgi:hypothetical protein